MVYDILYCFDGTLLPDNMDRHLCSFCPVSGHYHKLCNRESEFTNKMILDQGVKSPGVEPKI